MNKRDWFHRLRATLRRWPYSTSSPCAHALCRINVRWGENPRESGNVEVFLLFRCAACGADRTADFSILSESDGRIIIANETFAAIAIDVDGERHDLEPRTRRNPAAHVVRRRRRTRDLPPPPTVRPLGAAGYVLDDDTNIGPIDPYIGPIGPSTRDGHMNDEL